MNEEQRTHRSRLGPPRRPIPCRSRAPPPATQISAQTHNQSTQSVITVKELWALASGFSVHKRQGNEDHESAESERCRLFAGNRSAPLFSREAAIFWWPCDLHIATSATEATPTFSDTFSSFNECVRSLWVRNLSIIEPRLSGSSTDIHSRGPRSRLHGTDIEYYWIRSDGSLLTLSHLWETFQDHFKPSVTHPHTSWRAAVRPPRSNAGLLLVWLE